MGLGSLTLNYTAGQVDGIGEEREGDPGGNGKGHPPAEETSGLSFGTIEDKDRRTIQTEDTRPGKVWQQMEGSWPEHGKQGQT